MSIFSLKKVKYKDILHIEALKIKKGKVTSIVGESGSGKTTLLRLLNRLVSFDDGEILYDNQALNVIDPLFLRRQVVMLPQSPAIFKGSVKDNLLIGLNFSQKPMASEDTLSKVLTLVKLNKSLDDDADKLSGGEQQRLALARLILMEPEVLLLDEPSSALDEDTEAMIISALVDYTKKNNKTLIMVTHSKNVANTFSDEIYELKNGKIIDNEEV